jgi:citrate lyase subunit alpha/citrate CoA-transferase
MKIETVKNSIGREVPVLVPGLGEFVPFAGPYARLGGDYAWTPRLFPRKVAAPSTDKVAESLEEAIRRSGLESGMTISFHHHMRNGDSLVCMVLSLLEKMGIRNITLAPVPWETATTAWPIWSGKAWSPG